MVRPWYPDWWISVNAASVILGILRTPLRGRPGRRWPRTPTSRNVVVVGGRLCSGGLSAAVTKGRRGGEFNFHAWDSQFVDAEGAADRSGGRKVVAVDFVEDGP